MYTPVNPSFYAGRTYPKIRFLTRACVCVWGGGGGGVRGGRKGGMGEMSGGRFKSCGISFVYCHSKQFFFHDPTTYLRKLGGSPGIPFRQYGADKRSYNILRPCVTLKIWASSPKSNHFLHMFQLYIYSSLVEIQPSLKAILCTQAIHQHS